MKRTITTFFVSLMLIVSAFAQDTLFVKNSESSTAWAGRTAYTNLQDAIDAAQTGDMIWVEQGTYYPSRTFGNNTDTRCKSFVMKDGIALYGGFVGTENNIDDRAASSYVMSFPTILSGDFANTPDNNTDNSYHVIYCNGISDVTIDGFTITGGYANRNAYTNDQNGGGAYLGARCHLRYCTIAENTATKNGGGVWVSATADLTSCYIHDNSVTAVNSSGGGAFFDNRGNELQEAATNCVFESNSCLATQTPTTSSRNGGGGASVGLNVIMWGCFFEANTCTNPGGAVSCGSGTSFDHCEFYLNEATSGACIYGGSNSNLLTSNCLFANNAATGNGGAIYITGNGCHSINCTYVNNTATTGCAIYGSTGFTLFNAIVWNNGAEPANQIGGASNVTCMYTAIQGVTYSGEGNINVTTEEIAFSEPSTILGVPDDEEQLYEILESSYFIESESVCKDAGSQNNYYLSGYQFPDIDLYGEDRVTGTAIDLGCYENWCANNAPEYTWTVVDTTYSETEPGTGTVSIEFTVTNYDDDYDYYLDFGAGFPLTMEDGQVTVSFNFPGSHTIIISYTDEECGGEAEFVITLDSLFAPVGISENTHLNATIYPNPAHNTLTVESASPIREITVYDMAGHVVMVETCHGTSLQQVINTASLTDGIYILNIVTEHGTQAKKFVKK